MKRDFRCSSRTRAEFIDSVFLLHPEGDAELRHNQRGDIHGGDRYDNSALEV